jgi:hypothetical protein
MADHDNGMGNTVRESIQVADHFMFGIPPVLAQGATILVRDFAAKVITATVETAALEPQTAYSIWWVVFNRPKYCALPYECAGADLGNPAVEGSVFWGGGLLADGDEYGNAQIELRRGGGVFLGAQDEVITGNFYPDFRGEIRSRGLGIRSRHSRNDSSVAPRNNPAINTSIGHSAGN